MSEDDVPDAPGSNNLQENVNDNDESQVTHRRSYEGRIRLPENPVKQKINPLANLNVYQTIGLVNNEAPTRKTVNSEQIFTRPGYVPKDKSFHYRPGGQLRTPINPPNRRPAWKAPETIPRPEARRGEGGSIGYEKPFSVIPRETWGAAEPTGRKNMCHPIGYVFTGYTRSSHCVLKESCSKELLFVQKVNMKLSPDIKYNFLISDIGDVYEGRGWYTSPSLTSTYRDIEYTSLLIGFIGRFTGFPPGRNMMSALKTLIRHGMDNELICQDLLQFNLEGYVVTPFD